MRLPKPVYSDGIKKTTQVKFYGYDKLSTEGGIADMKNMTSDWWPELAPRGKRKIRGRAEKPLGIGAGADVIWADGEDLHIGDSVVEGILNAELPDKKIVVMGDYVTVWPDAVYYDTAEHESGSISKVISGGTGEYQKMHFGSTAGAYSDTANTFCFGPMAEESVSGAFRMGDAVTISGCTRHEENNKTVIIREFIGQAGICLDDTFALDAHLIYTAPADGLAVGTYNIKDALLPIYYHFILPAALEEGDTINANVQDIIEGTLTVDVSNAAQAVEIYAGAAGDETLEFETTWEEYDEPGIVTVARTVPGMDFVFEHANRLFGCAGDTIYVSALGDIFNWNVFDGVASDSWAAETGSQGNFTAACDFGGYPRFFKENRIFTLYGDYPGEYQLTGYEYEGVAEGSGKSIAVARGRLYYLSGSGVCAYAGSAPTLIADVFGNVRYKNGVGGSDGEKYYISMQDGDAEWHLFTYDTNKGLWMREDSLRVMGFAYARGLYYLTNDGTLGVMGRKIDETVQTTDEGTIEWFAEFGDVTGSSPDKKRLVKLQMRMELDAGTSVTVKLKYDSGSAWDTVDTITAAGKRGVVLPIIPRRNDHFRLRIEGTGSCRVSSITRQDAAGSER